MWRNKGLYSEIHVHCISTTLKRLQLKLHGFLRERKILFIIHVTDEQNIYIINRRITHENPVNYLCSI